MALLVNYSGVYTEPQKLWYLVDGVWKEVINVFESPIQQEIALVDAARIDQDKTVLSLSTRVELLQAMLDGSDPSVKQELDPVKISKINEEIIIINLQLEVAKLEQVAITKQLFEQKAQVEYKRLVLEGEKALEKISSTVDDIANWGAIRIDPQGPIDERLEVAIQHNLLKSDRIFNYGAVYYRLYKLDQINIEDNLADLADNFKRRLAKTDYANNTLATNYIMSTLTIPEVFNEVSQFISSGAQRILDFLDSLKDQQKYILDNMELVKDNLLELESLSLTSDLITKDTNGNIITNSTDIVQQKPLGKILLDSQGVTDFYSLVSQEVINGINTGTIDAASYPSYATTTNNMNSVSEKIDAIVTFKQNNDKILTDIKTGTITFTSVAIIGTRQASVSSSKNLFWNSPLGTSSIATAGDKVIYKEGYTSSGTYRFKSNELVTLSTQYVAIISTILANTKNVELAVSFDTTPVRIIQVVDKNTIQIELLEETSTYAPAIISVGEVNSKTSDTELFTLINDKNQPHDAVPFVKEVTPENPGTFVDLNVYHPVINSVFYPETYQFNWNETTIADTAIYDRAFVIYEVPFLSATSTSFSFNASETMSEYQKSDFAISYIGGSDTFLVFNAKSIPLGEIDAFAKNDNIINQLETDYIPQTSFNFNCFGTDVSEKFGTFMDNIVNQIVTPEDIPSTFNFNTYQMTQGEYTPRNGYAQKADVQTLGIDSNSVHPSSLSIITDETNLESVLSNNTLNLNNLEFKEISRIVITSQTGLSILEIDKNFDNLNIVKDELPKILTSTSIKITDFNNYNLDTINYIKNDVQRNITNTNVIILDGSINIVDTLNKTEDPIVKITTLTTDNTGNTGINITDEYLNKDNSAIVALAEQLNPGIQI